MLFFHCYLKMPWTYSVHLLNFVIKLTFHRFSVICVVIKFHLLLLFFFTTRHLSISVVLFPQEFLLLTVSIFLYSSSQTGSWIRSFFFTSFTEAQVNTTLSLTAMMFPKPSRICVLGLIAHWALLVILASILFH